MTTHSEPTSERPSVFTQLEDGGLALDTRDPVAMVLEWNVLHARELYLNENWSFSTLDEQSAVSKKKRAIEEACVPCHISPPRKYDLSSIAKKYDGQDVSSALRLCNHEAIDVLKCRIAVRINRDNGWIAQKVLAKHASELEALPESKSADVRATLSDIIWFLISAYYEDEVTRELGEPTNVYVGLNIRDLFASARYTYNLRNGNPADKTSIAGLIGVFAEFLPPLPVSPTDDDCAALSKLICTISTQGVAGGLTGAFGQTLASGFYDFVGERKGSVPSLIAAR